MATPPSTSTVSSFQYNLFANPIEDAVVATFPDFEGNEVEYKSASGGFPASFWDTYSAFANTEGGLIVLGVKEHNHLFFPDGLTLAQVQRFRQDFFNNQNNRQKISRDLISDISVKTVEAPQHPGQYLLAFYIPRATREQMPVYKGLDPFTGTYKRRDGGDYRCDRDAVRRMMADSDLSAPADSRILRGFVIDTDIDVRSLRQYRQVMASTRPGHPWLSEDDLSLLKKLGAYRHDRQSGQQGLTLAGVLMFGKTEAVRDNDCAPNFFPDYHEVLTTDAAVRWTDRIYPDGTWETNLFQFYQQVWPRISAGLPRPFKLKGGQRQDETPAHEALREAFINSLVHADYSSRGSLISVRRLNGFQFTNPGTLLISPKQYYEGGASVCRNKALQRMFTMIGGADQAGSGAAKIVKGWESAHWSRPYLSVLDHPDRVELELGMDSILPEQVRERLQATFGERAEQIFGDELTVLSIVAMEGHATHRRLQYSVDLHPTDLSKLLKGLCLNEFLGASGKGSGTTYALKEEGIFPRNMETSSKNVETSGENVETSGENVETSSENVETTITNLPKQNPKSNQAKIVEAAKDDWRTLDELAAVTGRTKKYLINKIIPDMIAVGLLERRYSAANHPQQAYRAYTAA